MSVNTMRPTAGGGRTQLVLSLALLALLLLFAILQGGSAAPRPYDLASAAPDGLRALSLWLSEMGYSVAEITGETFAIPTQTDLLFILPTLYTYTKDEVEMVAEWVTAGGTAVIVGPSLPDDRLAERFAVSAGALTPLFLRVTQQQPLLPDGTLPISLVGELPTLDLADAPHAVALLADGSGRITAAIQRYGEGTIWHFSRHHTFVNEQLRDPAQAALVPAFLRTVPTGGTIAIDTYHLVGPAIAVDVPVRTMQEWLYYTPWGWALLYLGGITAITLVLQGRRLGPPLPAQAEVRKREAAEYVIAMANLQRRARHGHVVAAHHKRRLKRALGQRLHVNATLDDAAFLQQINSQGHPEATTTTQAIAATFHLLDQATDDRALIQAIQRVDQVIALRALRAIG